MSQKKYKIAVLDDEPKMTKLIKMLLEESVDCVVDTFNTSEEALEKFKSEPYDLLSLDHRMPKLTGMDIVKLLRTSSGPNQTTRIILLTGYRDEAECSHIELLDEVIFQEKPINEERYLRWVNFLLKTQK